MLMNAMNIFLIDTNDVSVSSLEHPLLMSGFLCERCVIAGKMLERLSYESINAFKGVVILGEGLSNAEKEVWIRRFRELTVLFPVLVVTQMKNREGILSFDQAGMTDYICLPVRREELITRVSLLIRRAYLTDYMAHVLRNGPFVFSRFPNKVLCNGKEIILTVKEFELAYFLFKHLGQPLSRVTIEEAIWFSNKNELSRTIDTHISRVRNKLGLKKEKGYCLQQVYGYGYQLIRL